MVAAPVVTALAVGTGVVASGISAPAPGPAAAGSLSAARPAVTASERTLGTSRSAARVPLVNHRVLRAKGKLWSTADLNLRTEPRDKAKVVGLLDSGKRIAVTGRRQAGFAEVIVGDLPRWVTADYLSEKKKDAETAAPAGLSGAPCPDGSSIESGLQPAAVRVYRAACAAFPELSSYGGQDGHGEHVNGQAIDFMVPNGSVGQRLADYLLANAAALDLFDVIWNHRIWTIERSGEGWRSMSDRGSPTANHEDHVHIKVN